MPDPVIIPRANHVISRRDIDSDALKVLYRLREHRYAAYLVGGSVRDLLLGRRPKDFDIGTDAHPYQIKKLFRNCWIIGRRFRLAHIKFGPKTIEVATFRRIVVDIAPEEAPAESESVVVAAASPPAAAEPAAESAAESRGDTSFLHRDNTFGTPEEDAFRRDFTINGLFYDIATYSVIDFVGGLEDLDRRVVRSIGDPRVRFVEDPVRMLRAAVMSARLDFAMDPLVLDAIAEHRSLIAKASAARLLEEYYKILRSGCAESTFRALGKTGLLEHITPELRSPPAAFWTRLAQLDSYRQRYQSSPPELTNTILAGALLDPLGALDRAAAHPRQEHRITLGLLPLARRDLDRLHQVKQLQPRLIDPALPPRVARGMAHRPAFPDGLTWLEIFGDAPDAVTTWRQTRHEPAPSADGTAPPGEPGTEADPRKRRRRRRRRRRRAPQE